ncbi:MAG TPA: ABC transporter permease [Amoebophilaceae bacterium]|nr:ABC transporter permease [Amoebophilaceae bacterium]
MIGLQYIREVFNSLRAHKARTIFTGFGILWAMMILVLLQAAGTAYYKGSIKKLHAYGKNNLWIHPGYLPTGECVHLTECLADQLAESVPVFEQIMPIFSRIHRIAYGDTTYTSQILGVRMGYETMSNLTLVEGRLLTHRDWNEALPVCLLNSRAKYELFGKDVAIGQTILLEGTFLTVVGVFEAMGGSNNQKVIISGALFKQLFPQNSTTIIHHIASTLRPKADAVKTETAIRAYFAKQLGFDAAYKRALWINSTATRGRSFQNFFNVLKGFVWFVGGCFLISGIVGIGNMMLVVVKERTQELAIRKVLGAGTRHIIGLILSESIVISMISGIFGIGIGLSIVQGINALLLPLLEQHQIAHFEFQGVDACVALGALLVSGCLAGMIPAKRAVQIAPVNALNNE